MNDEARPVAYTAVERGTPVTSQSGQTFGTLERVLDDGKGNILHGIVVKTRRGLRFVARDSIELMTTRQIRCLLTDEQAGELPPASAARRMRTRQWLRRRA
ncbi:hypothetical protein [Arthrobacter sp. D1-17]